MDRLALRRSLSPSFELGVDERRIPVPTVEGRLPGCNRLPCAPPPMPRRARAGTVDPAAAIRNDRLPLFPVVTGLASNAAPLISPSDARPSSLLKDTLCVLPPACLDECLEYLLGFAVGSQQCLSFAAAQLWMALLSSQSQRTKMQSMACSPHHNRWLQPSLVANDWVIVRARVGMPLFPWRTRSHLKARQEVLHRRNFVETVHHRASSQPLHRHLRLLILGLS